MYEKQLTLLLDVGPSAVAVVRKRPSKHMASAESGVASVASHKRVRSLSRQSHIEDEASPVSFHGSRSCIDRQRLTRQTVVNLICFMRTISDADRMLQAKIDELTERIVSQYLDTVDAVASEEVSLSIKETASERADVTFLLL